MVARHGIYARVRHRSVYDTCDITYTVAFDVRAVTGCEPTPKTSGCFTNTHTPAVTELRKRGYIITFIPRYIELTAS